MRSLQIRSHQRGVELLAAESMDAPNWSAGPSEGTSRAHTRGGAERSPPHPTTSRDRAVPLRWGQGRPTGNANEGTGSEIGGEAWESRAKKKNRATSWLSGWVAISHQISKSVKARERFYNVGDRLKLLKRVIGISRCPSDFGIEKWSPHVKGKLFKI